MNVTSETVPVAVVDHPRQRREHAIATSLLVFVIALLPRVFVATRFRSEAVWDGHYYEFYARRIAGGFGYSDPMLVAGIDVGHPSCHYPVGYSAVLGVLYKILGPTLTVAGVFNALVGALLAVTTYRLATYAMSTKRALIAGLLVALHPGLILYAGLVMSEPLAALGTLLAFWVCVHQRARGHLWRGAIVSALVLGASALVRPQALLCAPLLAPLAWGSIGAREFLRSPTRILIATSKVALVCALALLPVMPWTARNCKVMDGCALVSTNGGWNLAIGAFPRATGRFEGLHSSDGCRDVTGQVNQDRCWFAYGVNQIKEHPGRWLALIPKKLGFTFDHESFAVEYLHEARPEQWPEPLRSRVREGLTFAHCTLLLLACFAGIGISKHSRSARIAPSQALLLVLVVLIAYVSLGADTRSAWPLAVVALLLPLIRLRTAPALPLALAFGLGLLASVIVTHAVFFGEDRYHLVATPVLCMLAAAVFRVSAGKDPKSGTVLVATT